MLEGTWAALEAILDDCRKSDRKAWGKKKKRGGGFGTYKDKFGSFMENALVHFPR
jgi:hypothetical protein